MRHLDPTFIEPCETGPVVRSAVAPGSDKARGVLKTGQLPEVTLSKYEGDRDDIRVSLVERKRDRVLREESTAN